MSKITGFTSLLLVGALALSGCGAGKATPGTDGPKQVHDAYHHALATMRADVARRFRRGIVLDIQPLPRKESTRPGKAEPEEQVPAD